MVGRRTLGRFTLATVALGMAACTRNLPPPEPPAAEISEELRARVRATEAPEGQGVVAFDVTEGTATVTEIGREADGGGRVTICETPCVTTLAIGEHELELRSADRTDTVTLTAEATPRAHVRVMSYDSGAHQEWLTLGVSGLLFGGMSLFLIEPLTSMGNDLDGGDVALITGAALGGAALVAGVVGVILAIVDPQVVREGASREFAITFD